MLLTRRRRALDCLIRPEPGLARRFLRAAAGPAVGLAVLLCLLADAAFAAETRPNILIITADNLGYGDLASYNPDSTIRTPHLDRLASQGARLTQFYTASPTCTVSRASLLTGRVPQRHGLVNQLPGLEGNYGPGLDRLEILMPQLLGAAGYATGCFGKWNIGFAPGSRPTERGFHEFFGHASGNIDYYRHIYGGKHDMYRGTEEAHVEGYSTDLFADAAIDFMRDHADRPWFVYLPFNAPHFPSAKNKAPGQPNIWQAPDRAFAVYDDDPQTRDVEKRYRAVVTALDEGIGRVLDALDELELSDDTFVFFYSDNGAFRLDREGIDVGINTPLRHGGVTCWEGGIRVPAFARWPGRIEAGSTLREPLWSPDLFVAAARLAEAQLPEDRTLDGRDPLPVLRQQEASPHRSFYFRFRSHAALRQGDWKIVRTQPDEPWMLFNLAEDIGEQMDLAEQHPERVAQLADEFDRWEQDTGADPAQ